MLSICIPALNAARTLEATLDSILSQEVDVEVVVLDNASTDATRAIAESFNDERLRVHSNDSVLDIGDNWNRAVDFSTRELIKVVCADDILMPGSLAAQIEVMTDPHIALSSSRFEVINEAGDTMETGLGLEGLLGMHTPEMLFRKVIREGPAEFGPTAAAIFRRTDFDRVGGFRNDYIFPMDVELFCHVAVSGYFYGIEDIHAAWRNSRFNLCSQTNSLSKLSDMYLSNKRLRDMYPDLVSRGDVAAGDFRLVGAGLQRLRSRASRVLPLGEPARDNRPT